jgi:hypothetical protein
MSKRKIKDIIYVCAVNGMVAPRAVCGAVSVYRDEHGHRCTAHGNTKCKHKKITKDI